MIAQNNNYHHQTSFAGKLSGVSRHLESVRTIHHNNITVYMYVIKYIAAYSIIHHLELENACLEEMVSSECGSQNPGSDGSLQYLAVSFQPNT